MKYIIVATLDDRTSDICLKKHGEIFEAREAEVGETIPPFHVNCRSIVIPFDEDDYIANGGEDDYEGWLEDYIGRYYGADAGSGDDINKRIEEIRKQLREPGITYWDMKRLERELEKLSGEMEFGDDVDEGTEIIIPGEQVLSEKGALYLGLLETQGSKYNVYDDGNLIGIISADLGDGGITYGFGHFVSYSDEEKQKILSEVYGLEFKEGVFVPVELCIEIKQDDVYNNKVDNLKDLDDFINRNNITLTQNQYDALVCMAFLRRIPQNLKELILQKNNDNDLYGDYEKEFYDIAIKDFKSISNFDEYGGGWTSRLKNEMDIYFRNDYSKKY